MGLLNESLYSPSSEDLIGSDENKYLADGKTPNPAFVAGMTREQYQAGKSQNNNPFAIKNYGNNNPDMQLIKDPDSKAAMQRSAMFRGLGDAGQALMANSGKSVGEAFVAGAGAFQKGADADIAKGVLVNDKRKAQVAEEQRQAGIKKLGENPNWTRQQKEAYKASQLFNDPSIMKSYFEKPEGIGKINPDDFTPESVQAYNKSERDGNPDYSLLDPKESVRVNTMGDEVKMTQTFESQAEGLLGMTFLTDSLGNDQITSMKKGPSGEQLTGNQAEEIQRELVAEAYNLYIRGYYNDPKTGQLEKVTPANAMNFAANRYRLETVDSDTGKLTEMWNIRPIKKYADNQADTHGLLKPEER